MTDSASASLRRLLVQVRHLDPFIIQIRDHTALDLNSIRALAMILRVFPARQRAIHELVQTTLFATTEGVVHHDALVVKLLAAGLDRLAIDIGTLDILTAAVAVV